MAFHDRWHAYLPGWEVPKMQSDYFTWHPGFISTTSPKAFTLSFALRNYTDIYDRHFSLGSHVEERDRKAIARDNLGLDEVDPSRWCLFKARVEDYLKFAIEVRRRVKEQLEGIKEIAPDGLRLLEGQRQKSRHRSRREHPSFPPR